MPVTSVVSLDNKSFSGSCHFIASLSTNEACLYIDGINFQTETPDYAIKNSGEKHKGMLEEQIQIGVHGVGVDHSTEEHIYGEASPVPKRSVIT